MSHSGIQWKLISAFLGIALLASGVTALALSLGPTYVTTLLHAVGLESAEDVTVNAAVGALAVFLVVAAALLSGLYVAREIRNRLREMGRIAGYIAGGDLSQRVPTVPADEIGELGWQFNRMTEKLASTIGSLQQLAARNAELAADAAGHAALAERTRLARDLHDSVNQQLFSLNMQAATAERKLSQAGPDTDLEPVRQALRQIAEMARSIHAEMRSLILQLRPVQDSEKGLQSALPAYVAEWSRRSGIASECKVELNCGRLSPAVEDEMFRIAQEALTNVGKHAQASRVQVRIEEAMGGIRLRIADDGKGFDPDRAPQAGSFGLRGMAERAHAISADLRLKAKPGEGTQVELWLPLAAAKGGA